MTEDTAPTAQEVAMMKGEAPLPAAETPSAPAEAPKTDAPAGAEGKPQEHTMISHAAFHEERLRRKELAKQLQAVKEEAAQYRGRLEVIEALRQGNAKPAEPPSPETDPLGYVTHTMAEIRAQQEALAKRQAEFLEQNQHQSQAQQFMGAYQAQAQAFAAKTPDFNEAYKFLAKSRIDELTAGGYSQEEAEAVVLQNEAEIVARAFQNGQNPAEAMYKIASLRGYKAAGAVSAEAQKVATAAKAQAAGVSLSSVPGGAAPELTALSLLAMDEEEFAKVPPAVRKRIMGG